MFVVTVTFETSAEDWPRFLERMTENARASVAEEPGCLQFDVCTLPERPHTVFLYEVYTDKAAFDAHLVSPHFRAFDAAVANWVQHKEVVTMERIAP